MKKIKNQFGLFNKTKYKHKQPEPLNTNNEYWKPMYDYSDKYEISNYGRVRSISNNSMFKAHRTIIKGKTVTPYITIRKNKTKYIISIARLMYLTFTDIIPDYSFRVCHKDSDLFNNNLDNLFIKKSNHDNHKLRSELLDTIHGNLRVVERVDKVYWKCLCDCGNTCLRTTSVLYRKHKNSFCNKSCDFNPKKALTETQKIFSSYRRGAKERKYEFKINRDFFNNTIKQPCVYCGDLPNPNNGIDRKDNTIGYIESNCVPCCKICNYAKRDMTYHQWVNWLCKLSERVDIIKSYYVPTTEN